MIITDIKAKNKKKSSIYINDEYCFDLYNNEIKKFKFKIGNSISQNEYDSIVHKYLYQKAKDKAILKLAKCIDTRYRMLQYLLRKGFGQIVSNKVVDELDEKGYIDDNVYTQKYINDRMGINPISAKELFVKLKNKGISDDIIYEQIKKANVDDYETAYILASKKIKSIDINNYEDTLKIKRYLGRKGFEFDTINRVLERIKDENEK